jgi:hypothetical protein
MGHGLDAGNSETAPYARDRRPQPIACISASFVASNLSHPSTEDQAPIFREV